MKPLECKRRKEKIITFQIINNKPTECSAGLFLVGLSVIITSFYRIFLHNLFNDFDFVFLFNNKNIFISS